MLSRFNAGCDCDCCIIYKSEFCKNWYESVFERKYFGDINGNPSSVVINGGSFDQVGVFQEDGGNIWQIRNDACGSSISSCETSTDSKGWKYSANHYLTPTGNLSSSYLSTILVASKYQWWLHTFWDTCDSSDGAHCWDSSTGEPVRNQKMMFLFDYKDEDNWVGIEVEYKPDFDVTPGAVENVFEIRGRQKISGTTSYFTNAFTVDLGTGSTKKEVGIEINVDQRTECGTKKFVAIDFGGSSIGFDFDGVGGDRCALYQLTPSGVVDTLNCSGTDYTVGVGFGVYTWVHQYLDSESTGCAEYTSDCCSCYVPSEIDVTFSGWSGEDCDLCADELDETYTLKFVGQVGGFDCTWFYQFDAYSQPTCTVDDIELTLVDIKVRRETGTKWVVELNVETMDQTVFTECRFLWEYDEGTSLPSLCNLDGTEAFTRLVAGVDYTSGACKDFDDNWLNITDFCETEGSVVVANA